MKRTMVRSGLTLAALIAVAAVVVTLLAVHPLSWPGQTVSAQPAAVLLLHVSPDGTDYTGNPYCPGIVWVGGEPTVNPWHDCNNIISQNHVIRTAGWATGYSVHSWNVESFSGAVATIQAQGRCGDIALVTGRVGWNAGQCSNTTDDDGDTLVNDGCPGQVPETGTQCANATNDEDNDPTTAGTQLDGFVNDGCPAVGAAETICTGNVDDDGDTKVNDGCPGQVPETVCTGAVDEEDNDPTTAGIQLDGFVNDGCPDVGVSEDPDDQQCLVIHSSTPGETRVTLTYSIVGGTIYVTPPVVKEWDSLVDSVILKYGDLEKVKVHYDANGDTVIGSSEYKELYLPPDVDSNGRRDATDEHLLDKQGKWQDHGVVWDEALKRIRSLPPVQITEVVHGEHNMMINGQTVTFHQPTEGSIVTATIESPRFCTFFTNATGSVNYGATVSGVSDNLGRLVVYVDTVCEEQATINFHDDYPGQPGSQRLPVDEWVGINWTTIEQAKQPQVRWAGEEIVLAKRWALPNDWYPNLVSGTTTPQPVCPWASNFDVDADGDDTIADLEALGHVLDTDGDTTLDTILDYWVAYYTLHPSPGVLEGAWWDEDGDGVLDSFNDTGGDQSWGEIDMNCISKGLYSSEDPGTVDVEANLIEKQCVCSPTEDAPAPEWMDQQGGGGVACYDTETSGYPYGDVECYEALINKHAFLVWYLNIYQVKLTNVDGEREYHNDGAWNQGDGEDSEAATLNVSQDTLLRVKAKGWLFSANLSGRGAVCVDMDGDGDEAGSEPGVPYPIPNEAGCPDAADEMLENGHWVLPDDLVALAGPDAIRTRPNWDVMSEADAAYTGAIGPKSTLDSHDAVLRPWLGRKTVVPDGAITAADAIMPPLKIRASIATDGAGYLKEALKGVIYPTTNDYHSIMIPADREIPAMVTNGGYGWASWTMPSCPDADSDGICDAADKCPINFDPTNGDLDGDGTGDVCDNDADGDAILNDGADGIPGTADDDNCRLKANANQADADSDGIGDVCDTAAGLDTDGDTVLDAVDNCPTKSNANQLDTDKDGYGDACDSNPGLPWWQTPPVPYPFWTIINQFEREDPDEADPALKKRPYYIEFYTDNRGEGMFFANGDFMLSYDECRTDPVSGAPDCSPGKVVGNSTITVIGDYPYFRKHSAVLSNPVEKTWTWGGFKRVTAEQLDANHTAIIAHLKDRDGFCKYDVGSDPTAANGVTTSPSLHPVQGEEIEFILNTNVGHIIDVSPNGVYQPPAPHAPLTDARVVRLEDGVIIDRSEAVALAEDGRVLGYFDEARGIDEGLVAEEDCQAWIVIEHPLGEEPNVSVRFHDPEGVIMRHWPPAIIVVSLGTGWNDSCYAGPSQPVEDAVADIADHVLVIYRLGPDQTWRRYIPGRPEIPDTLTTLNPYDQLFILMAASADWMQEITAPPTSVDLAQGWNSVCYAGADKPTEEATANIADDLSIMLALGSDQMWRRHLPGRPDIETLTTLHMFDSVVLRVTAEGGTTWVFDPPAIPSQTGSALVSTPGSAPADLNLPPSLSLEQFCDPVFPGTYYGTVMIDGLPAPDGTTIWAVDSDGIAWASATTSGGRYVFEVPMGMPVAPPCFAGGELTFRADGASCQESAQLAAGPQDLNLSCGQALVGDADGNGKVDAVDAMFILQYVVGLRAGSDQCPAPPGEICLHLSDADCDDDVDAVDALFVLQYVVGLRPELCPGP